MLLFYKYNLLFINMKKKELLAEFLGTFILVFAWTWAMIVDNLTGALWNVWIGLVFWLVIVVLVYTFWHISWAHFNPAVTIWLSIAKKFDRSKAIDYITAQILWWIFASFVLYLIFLSDFSSFEEIWYMWATLPRWSVLQSFILEFILTFILLIVIYFTAIHKKAVKWFAGLAIGFTIWLEAIFAWPITGASMNPARSIGPAFISFHFEHLWLYIVATILGAIIASLLYRWFEKWE